MPINQVVVQTVAGRERLGAVTAMVSLFRSIGAAGGAAVFGALVYAFMPAIDVSELGRAATDIPTRSVTHAFHVAFVMASLVAACAAIAASRVPRVRLWPKPDAASAIADVKVAR